MENSKNTPPLNGPHVNVEVVTAFVNEECGDTMWDLVLADAELSSGKDEIEKPQQVVQLLKRC